MKSVCVVGAGPAGLVAAKTFLQCRCYSVTVYEAADRVGGMWRVQDGDTGDKCSPGMATNLSRFTVAFSDLSWSSVDLSDPVTGSARATPQTFPKAWQVGRYLEAYKKKFALEGNILLNKRVVKARLLDDFMSWEVVSEDTKTKQRTTATFDYLVIASGFFDTPGHSFKPSLSGSPSNLQHSSHFRELSTLTDKAGKIAVIGGGISGAEVAAQAAFQVSNAKNAPGNKETHAESKIYHIINRPLYFLPRYLPQDPHNSDGQTYNPAPKFLPIDLVLYNLSRVNHVRPPTTSPPAGTLASASPVGAQSARGHDFMRSLLGGDQSDLGRPEVVYNLEQMQYPGYTAITDTYAEFVRSGIIVPVKGWVDEVKQHENSSSLDISLAQYEPWHYTSQQQAKSKSTVTDVTGIIEATGYKVALDYLDETVRDVLYYDPSCSRIPFLLKRHSALSALPSLGFVGFYQGPYWGVMEMQARFIAETWVTYAECPLHLPDRPIYQLESTESMRRAMEQNPLHIRQFWMSDYTGIVEEFAQEIPVTRDDSTLGTLTGPIFPSRYGGLRDDPEAAFVVQEVTEVLRSSNENAKFVAVAVFRGMQGVWNVQHKIDLGEAASPSGTFFGTAHFHPRNPTSPEYSAEYLYIEEGSIKISNGHSSPTNRRYVYRYSEVTDKITAWLVEKDNESVGALFNTWDFYAPDDSNRGWLARGQHWYDQDTYKNVCEFRFRGASLQTFTITHQYEGPKESSSRESLYQRPEMEVHISDECAVEG